MPEQIKRYKVTSWLNKVKNEPMFGIKVFVVNQGWCDVAEDGKGLFFETAREAEAEIKRMKSERDRRGWKVVRATRLSA